MRKFVSLNTFANVMTRLLQAGLVGAAFTAGVLSTQLSAQPGANPPGKIADEQLFGFIGKDPLPAGTIPWQILRQVKLVEGIGKDVPKAANKAAGAAPSMRPEFSPKVLELDKKEVKLYGFVMPLSTAPKQTHFLLSPLPTHCPYCVYQGPDSLVEVIAKIPVEFNQWEPIVVTGKFELVSDPQLFYRLTNAQSVKF